VAKDLNGKRSRPLPTEALVSVVAATDACRLAQVTGLNDEEQYLFAHERLIHAPKAGDAANMCQEQFAIAERTVGKVDKKLTRGFGNAWLRTQCLVRVGACKELATSPKVRRAPSTKTTRPAAASRPLSGVVTPLPVARGRAPRVQNQATG
jgi:hypothetical protein